MMLFLSFLNTAFVMNKRSLLIFFSFLYKRCATKKDALMTMTDTVNCGSLLLSAIAALPGSTVHTTLDGTLIASPNFAEFPHNVTIMMGTF